MGSTGCTLLLACLTLTYTRLVFGIRCLECTDTPTPQSCSVVTTCGDGDLCSVEQYITSGGLVLYRTGCMSKLRCTMQKRDLLHQSVLKRSDLTMCVDCCSDEFCNRQGCGQTAVTQPDRGPACFKCDAQAGQDQCRDYTDCDIDDVCFLSKSDTTYSNEWQTGCIQKQQCETLKNVTGSTNDTHCPLCCSTDFCNDNCIEVSPQTSTSTGSTVTQTTSSTSTIPSTNTPLVTTLTNSPLITTSTVRTYPPSLTPPSMSSKPTGISSSTTSVASSQSITTSGIPITQPVSTTVTKSPTTMPSTTLPPSTARLTSTTLNQTQTSKLVSTTIQSTLASITPNNSPASHSSSRPTPDISNASSTLSNITTVSSATSDVSSSLQSSTIPQTSVLHVTSTTLSSTSKVSTTKSTHSSPQSTSGVVTTTLSTLPNPGSISECTYDAVDLVFVLDNSDTTRETKWHDELNLVKDLVDRFTIGLNSTRVGVVLYNNNAHIAIPLQNRLTKTELLNNIAIQPLGGREAHLEKALYLVNTNILHHHATRPTYVIVIARQHFNAAPATTFANRLKSISGVTLIAGSYGHSPDRTTLSSIASSPDSVVFGISANQAHSEEKFIDTFTTRICTNQACYNLRKNVCFVLDSSGSMTPLEFHKQLEFVLMVASDLHIGHGAPSSICVVTFNNNASVKIQLTDAGHLTKQQFAAKLFNISYSTGETRTDLGLWYAFSVLEHAHHAPDKTIVVLTDGRSTLPHTTKNAVTSIHAKDNTIDILAVGIGDNIDKAELTMIASDQNDVFTVNNFNDLDTIHKQLVAKLCLDDSKASGSTTIAPVTTTKGHHQHHSTHSTHAHHNGR